MTDHAIQFDGVHRHFGAQPVLRGLDLRVPPGQVYTLLGRNGTGKTTAIRILLGLLQPHGGRATVLGRDSQELRPEDRGRIGYVAERHPLYPTMRVRDAIAFEAETRSQFHRSYAEVARERCGLPASRPIALLSRGQRAQLALILAVACDPEVLVFDDPAMGLDVVMRREFLDVMIDLLAERGAAVLFSSHILTDVERVADRIGILHEGSLIVDATMDDLKTRVQKRTWVATNGDPSTPPAVDGLLRARQRGSKFELTLLDLDDARESQLQAGGTLSEDAAVPDLEELFYELTVGESGPMLADLREMEGSR